ARVAGGLSEDARPARRERETHSHPRDRGRHDGIVPAGRPGHSPDRARPASPRTDRARRRARCASGRAPSLRSTGTELLGGVAARHRRDRTSHPRRPPHDGVGRRRTRMNGLTRAEIQELLQMKDSRTWWSLIVDWGLIAGSFALVAVLPNPFTVIL